MRKRVRAELLNRNFLSGVIFAFVTSFALNGIADLSNAVFYADFELSTPVNDLVTSTNLNAGTAIGTWTVTDFQESDIRQGGGTTALLADTGAYDFTANFYAAGILEDNGITVSLDTCMRRTDDASSNTANLKPQKIVGIDTHGHELFDIRINAGNNHPDGYRVGYVDQTGTIQYLGQSGDVNVRYSNTPDTNAYQKLELTLHATTMDISYDGNALTNGIPYRNNGVNHISGLQLAGVNGKTGAFYDNIVVSANTIAALSGWQRQGFIPFSAQGDNLIHVRTADFDGVGAKDYVVGMSVNNKLIAFDRQSTITNSFAPGRRWEVQLPSFAVMIETADIDQDGGSEEVLVPGTDGHLRIYSQWAWLREDITVSSGALYCAGVGKKSNGDPRVIVGGVDGNLYFYHQNGTLLNTVRPQNVGIIRRVAVGNFDGIGGDEVMVFYSKSGYSSYRYIDIYDLDTLARPAYWNLTAPLEDDVATITASAGMGWTDKQTARVYDMDGDGDEEVVANWGVIHPENGAASSLLSTAFPQGELLYLSEYDNFGTDGFTDTGKYQLQHGVPGNFSDLLPGGEMFTLYGDDLYLVDYDISKSVDVDRFSIKKASYAHTLYHFTDGARLEDRNGGPDKLVLSGPANGDDHYYIVDLSSDLWMEDGKYIDGYGLLGQVRSDLDVLEDEINTFNGTVASAGKPIYYIDYFSTYLGWAMTPENIATHADAALASMQAARDKLGGTTNYIPNRVRFVASMYSTHFIGPEATDPDITPAGVEAFCRALAQRGVHFCVEIGHNSHTHMTPDDLANLFEASVTNGECYLMARTAELEKTDYIDQFKPHMDAVIARAQLLGIDPPRVIITAKGPNFSAMTPSQASSYFPTYKNVMVPGIECSNVTMPAFCYAEQVGLWLNNDVAGWSCNLIGDNLAANRIMEWGGIRNGHVVLRFLLSQYALGADIFRVTSIEGDQNPLYLRGDTTDPELELSSAYRQGIWNFLKLVEAGAYPNGPDASQLKGISPVAAALPTPDTTSIRLHENKHSFDTYSTKARPYNYVLNGFSCWDAYTPIPDYDLTAIMHHSTRRWDNLIPTSPSGFVAAVPHASRSAVEANSWCNRAYETDVDTWAEFSDLSVARDTISAELIAQRQNMLFYVDGECFWQVTEDAANPDTLFVAAIDSSVLTPTNRTVYLKKGAAVGAWEVYDQFGSQLTPLGQLATGLDEVMVDIPAGSVRLLAMHKNLPPVWQGLDFGDATEDAPYAEYTAWRISDPEGDNLTFAKVSGPAWISVNPGNGYVTGTPVQADVGTNTVIISASDGYNAPVDGSFIFNVINVNDAPVFSSNPISGASAATSIAYDDSLAGTATDEDPGDTLTYSKVSGPAWLSVAADGTLSGMPGSSDAGTNVFSVQVADAAQASDTATLNVVVSDVNLPPVWGDINYPDATENSAYVGWTLWRTTDPEGDTLTFAKVSGPAWISLDTSTGKLTGTPAQGDVGTVSLVISASDGVNAPVEAAISFNVINVNDAPVFSSGSLMTADAYDGVFYSNTLEGTASDVDPGDTLTYSKVSGPAWLTIAADGTLSGTPGPADVGTNSFSVQVADAALASDTATLTIQVNGWTQLLYDDFEGGFGNWTDGGTDCKLYTGATQAHQGNNAADLQDNTSTSVMDTGDLALSSKSQIQVEFWCYPKSMENSEDFWLQISTDGGANYSTVKAWVHDVDFTNGVFFQDTVTISGVALTDQTRLRFRCDASGNADDVYLDEVRVSIK